MTLQEFRKRTEKFLMPEAIASYAEYFEPAYMEMANMDKDDFCAALKDEAARNIVIAFSAYIVATREREKAVEGQNLAKLQSLNAALQNAEDFAAKLRKAVTLIQATVDRALA